MTRPTAEEGFVAGAESLAFGVLVFVVGTLIAVNAWAVIDAKFATSAAAREAVRAATASAPGDDLAARARAAARRTLEAHGRDAATLEVAALGAPRLERCAEVGYRVSVRVPAVAVLGDRHVGAFRVASEHHELVEPYRAGLPVDAEEGVRCAW